MKSLGAAAFACLRPSSVMLITAGVVVISFLFWVAQITPQSLNALLEDYPGFATLDDRYYLFHRLTELNADEDRSGLQIVILGGSTTRESIWTGEDFANHVSDQIGEPVSAIELTSAGQRLTLTWALIEQTICQLEFDVAVVGVNMGRFRPVARVNPAEQIGYRSSAIDSFYAAESRDTVPYLVNNPQFVLRSLYLIPHLELYKHTGSSRYNPNNKNALERHRSLDTRVRERVQVKKRLKLVADEYSGRYAAYGQESFTILERISDAVRDCGGILVLADTPVNPRLLNGPGFANYQEAYRKHQQAIASFADKRGLEFVNPNNLIEYRRKDSNDQGHLRREEAIRATSNVIADAVAKSILRDKSKMKEVARWD